MHDRGISRQCQIVCLHIGDGSGQVAFFHCAVSYHDNLLQYLVIRLHRHVDRCPSGHRHRLGLHPHIAEYQCAFGWHIFQHILPVDIGNRTDRAVTLYHNGCSDNGQARIVHDRTAYSNGLSKRSQRYCPQQGKQYSFPFTD